LKLIKMEAQPMEAQTIKSQPTKSQQLEPQRGTTHKECDLCAGTAFERIAEHDRKGQPLETVICRRCGLVAHQQIPTERELAEFYQSSYREDYHGETTPSERRVMRAWRNGARIYRQLQDYIVPSDDVLEVGAGIGCTVKQFERHGHRACGIEPHTGFQQYSVNQLHATVTQASLFDMPPRPAHDVVLLVHVIEHFRSPHAALSHLHSIVRPGGLLYIECPNLGAPFAMRDKLFHFAHIHNFTARTLEMMALRCGFVLERSFTNEGADQALEMLFRKDEPHHADYADSYAATMAALSRHSWTSYHLRWQYLWPRLRKLGGYAVEHLCGKQYVQSVLRQCGRASQPQANRAA
jgi:2-polyprenyl-3-methyl-5-hydroxy-6-metoxy-1,4-benzoquinol methylase